MTVQSNTHGKRQRAARAARLLAATTLTTGLLATGAVQAQGKDLKIGTVLSFSQVMGVYGNAIMDGFNLAMDEVGGTIAGRKVVVVREDDKNDPKVALQLARKLIKDENVDFLVGPVGSHIAAAIRDEVHRSKTFLLVANAGNDELTREQCSPYILRASFSNWQWNYPLGEYAASQLGKRAAIVASNFVAGKQMASAFGDGFKKGGGAVVDENWPAMGTADFANVFTKLRGMGDKVDVVYAFIPGSGTVNYINQFAQASLKMANVGPQSNADNFFFDAMKDNALGVIGAGHYVVTMDTPRNKAFVEAFKKKYNRTPAAVDLQGYDSAKLIQAAVIKLKGDLSDKKAVRDAMIAADIDSPRGYFKIDPVTGNAIQNIYITKVAKRADGQYVNEIIRTMEKVRDPDTSCKLEW
jgi:branched-chain amino acid transport system substrate-binding protein